jgi:hypothetical protein
MSQVDRRALRQLLEHYFNISELRTLCFDLHIEYENLAGDRKADKTRELIEYAERYARMDELLTVCRRLRPHVNWKDVELPLPSQWANEQTTDAAAPDSPSPDSGWGSLNDKSTGVTKKTNTVRSVWETALVTRLPKETTTRMVELEKHRGECLRLNGLIQRLRARSKDTQKLEEEIAKERRAIAELKTQLRAQGIEVPDESEDFPG